ncbi:MAG TPA: single-stranded DNA-binding protein [Longimicrobiales bacterium]|nr:single-stranded DNA-binding protein [Longimicrobiales bacterium]
MARSLNKVMLIGNVGAEPEIRTVSGGRKVAKVSIATNRSFTDRSGQRQEKTEWHRCTFFERLADLVEQYVHKGDRIYVEGQLEYSQTEDDKGNVRYWTDIVIRDMVMLGSGGGSGGPSGDYDAAPRRRQAQAPAGPPPSPFDQDDDDLPF